MDESSKVVDPAFEGAGQAPGLEVWRIENFEPVRVPESDVGKFYTGDSYIILKTTVLKSGAFQYDVHFWLGQATSQDEAGTAAIKTVELDTILDDRAVQYREVQGHETDKFLSYFKPCIIPLEGGVASGFKQVEAEEFEPRLYTCKGRRAVRVKQVPFLHSSLNHDDVFILDTQNKIYQFNGSTSSIQERAKALEVVQYVKERYHHGTCDVAIIDDSEPHETGAVEFWNLFGGFTPIEDNGIPEGSNVLEASSAKLYVIEEGSLSEIKATPLKKDLLETSKCYLLDSGAEIYVWTGGETSLSERKAAFQATEKLLSLQNRPKHTHITRLIEGSETLPFRTNFDTWPVCRDLGVSENSRNVSAKIKQRGMDARFSDQACNEEELPPLFDNSGSLQVYRVDDTGKCPISQFEHGNFFTGDCYIVSYKHTEEEKDAYFFYCWIGSFSTQEDQAAAFELVTKDASIQGGKAVQGYIFEGQEPPEFIGLFQKFFLLKGGLSSGYQRRIRDESLTDDAYNEDGVALFHVEGTGPHNNKAVQLSLDVRDLNSCSCYILHAGGTLYVWNGNHSTSVKQEVAMKLAESFKQGSAPESLKEGSEPSEFWDALGGKKFCSSNSQVNQISNDPRLFACSILDGKLEAAEIFNYTQSDLLSEDVMLLDAHTEVFVWVGANADAKEKQQAFQMAQKYVQQRAALEGLPETVSQYILTEGNEPFFFTKHFKKWDKIKTSGQGNSFQKRIALLLGEQFQKPNKNEAMTASSSSKDVERKDSSQPGEYIPYERLKVDSDDPAAGVDPEKRESYLSPDEFMELFGMDSEQFYELPKWKQEKHKKTLNLF